MLSDSLDQSTYGKFGLMTLNCPRKTAFFTAFILSFFIGPLAAQQPPVQAPSSSAPAQDTKTEPKQQAPKPISVSTENVVVPVTVKDRSGNLVADLRKENSGSSKIKSSKILLVSPSSLYHFHWSY